MSYLKAASYELYRELNLAQQTVFVNPERNVWECNETN